MKFCGSFSLSLTIPDLQWDVVGVPVSSPASAFNNELLAAVAVALEPIHPGLPIVPQMGSGTTDGAYFRAAGIPSYSLSGHFYQPERQLRSRAE
jgi:acetylornithine deacetylase/succinyl-diaminopimelate desuccinylase-like protein